MQIGASIKIRAAGFTLIELVVVIVIISIMSAAIVGEMTGSFRDVLLRSTGRQLISAINLASSRAVSLNRLHRIHIDRIAGRYFIEKHERGDDFAPARDISGGSGAIDSRIAVRIQDPVVESDTNSPDVVTESPEISSDNTISFYPDGTTDGREIELRDRDGFGMALRVSAITARVQVIDLPRQ